MNDCPPDIQERVIVVSRQNGTMVVATIKFVSPS